MAVEFKRLAFADDLHAAVTIDGTSPLSLSGQAISLKNDAAAAITEVDTGTLADSDTVVPTSKAVKTVVDTKATSVADLTVTVGSGKDYATIQGAIDYFKGKQLRGTCVIDIDAGTYDEQLDISGFYLSGTLHLKGDERLLGGVSYVNGQLMLYSLTNAGSGTITITRGGAGNTVLTVTGSTTSPDFDADGWGAGDKVLVYTGTTPNTIVEMTLASASNNTLTATGAWPEPGAGTSGAGYTIIPKPNVIVSPTVPSSTTVSIYSAALVELQGIYIYNSSGTYVTLAGIRSAVYLRSVIIYGGYYSLQVARWSELTSNASFPLALLGSVYGVSVGVGSRVDYSAGAIIKVETAGYGALFDTQASAFLYYVKSIKNGVGFQASQGAVIYAYGTVPIGCTTDYSPTVNTVGNANAYILKS